jgi:hypothetical protein
LSGGAAACAGRAETIRAVIAVARTTTHRCLQDIGTSFEVGKQTF